MPLPLTIPYHSRRFQAVTIAVALATAGTLTGLSLYLFGGTSTQARVPANNISRNFRACLITENPDTAAAQQMWTGVRDAAGTTTVNAQRVITPANATTTAALLPYVESLIQRKCGLIISTGPHLDVAIISAATENPKQHFLTVGAPSSLPNITTLSAPMAAAVTSAVRAASRNHNVTTSSPGPTSQ